MLAIKCVSQTYSPSEDILQLLEDFREMVNDCIRIGLANNVSTLKRLSQLSYRELAKYDVPSYYKLCAISKAAGILSNRKKSIRRGIRTRSPYMKKLCLISCYGFKIAGGILRIPLGDKRYFEIPLNGYVKQVLSDPSLRMRSFTLTASAVSICYSKEVAEVECTRTAGVDINLRNATYGNAEAVVQYDLTKAVNIAESMRQIVASFRRDDARIRKKLAAKYGRRMRNRIRQLLHRVSKHMVIRAVANKEALVLERLTGIRRLYRRGNGQGRRYRARMNSWPFRELRRQVEYKARWHGIPVTCVDARGTSSLCPRCGKRTQSAGRDELHWRQVWCSSCKRWMDRDVIAAINLSIEGGARFRRSEGSAGEARMGNAVEPLILRVDAGKLTFGRDR